MNSLNELVMHFKLRLLYVYILTYVHFNVPVGSWWATLPRKGYLRRFSLPRVNFIPGRALFGVMWKLE